MPCSHHQSGLATYPIRVMLDLSSAGSPRISHTPFMHTYKPFASLASRIRPKKQTPEQAVEHVQNLSYTHLTSDHNFRLTVNHSRARRVRRKRIHITLVLSFTPPYHKQSKVANETREKPPRSALRNAKPNSYFKY
jgi:hypothetical protein